MERSDVQRDPVVQMLSVLGDLYRARLGNDGALAVYRHAQRPNHRRAEEPGEEDDQEEAEENENDGDNADEAALVGPVAPPGETTDTELEGDKEDGEGGSDLEVSPPNSAEMYGSDLVSAPSLSLDPDSQDALPGGGRD
eukprot:s107_g10.t1